MKHPWSIKWLFTNNVICLIAPFTRGTLFSLYVSPIYSAIVFPAAQEGKIKKIAQVGRIVMTNSHIVCLIWSCMVVIVMKHHWRQARERWRLHSMNGTIHPFIALGFPHSRKYSGACEGWMRAGELQECWGNHYDKWCISAMHCELCFNMTAPLWRCTFN